MVELGLAPSRCTLPEGAMFHPGWSPLGTGECEWRSSGLEAGITGRGRAWGRVEAFVGLAQPCSSTALTAGLPSWPPL